MENKDKNGNTNTRVIPIIPAQAEKLALSFLAAH